MSLDIKTLVGKTFNRVHTFFGEDGDEIHFEGAEKFVLKAASDWCNSAYIEEQNGDLSDLEGVPIEEARESSNNECDEATGIQTQWTFYTFRTIKGTVDLRWYAKNTEYYSVDVVLTKRAS